MHDRGSIKWTSLMLPEHVELLKRIWSEDKKVEKPSLDEQELEVINNRILEAYYHKETIQIKYFKDNQIRNLQGIIKKIDPANQLILMKDLSEATVSIPFTTIYQII